MTATERRNLILDSLAREGTVAVADLQSRLGASAATVRRDLDRLQAQGKALRTHGAVIHPDTAHGDVVFTTRRSRFIPEKRAIARRANSVVPAGVTVYVDAGTTTVEAGRLLLGRADLLLVTNSVALTNLAGNAEARVICIGGEIRSRSLALVGSPTRKWLESLRFDIALIGASGLDADDGIFTTELSEASVKSEAIAHAASVLVLADSSKWNQPAAVRFSPWCSRMTLVTDCKLAPSDARRLKRQHGVATLISD